MSAMQRPGNSAEQHPKRINTGFADALRQVVSIDGDHVTIKPCPALMENVSEEREKDCVRINCGGKRFWYDIRSWRRIFDLCDILFAYVKNAATVRIFVRKAMTQLVQSHCDRHSFKSIPSDEAERFVLAELERQFPLPGRVAAASVRASAPAPAGAQSRTGVAPAAAAAVAGVATVLAAKDAGATPAARLAKYLTAKKQGRYAGATHDLSGAFTRQPDGARVVWIGLDFGTQNIKVAFRDSEDEERVVLIESSPFATGIGRYMFAPKLFVAGEWIGFADGDAGAPAPSWKHALSVYYGESYAKHDGEIETWLESTCQQSPCLGGRSKEQLVLFYATVHLAFVLGRVGQLITARYQQEGVRDPLAFRLFMCAPVGAIDSPETMAVFQDCLTMADQLCGCLDVTTGKLRIEEVVKAFDRVRTLGVLHSEQKTRRARVVPEVLAEIASYTQSRSARPGFYALVDIGAGTLDLNIFKFVRTPGSAAATTPIYAATCNPNGVRHLEHLLLEALPGCRHSDCRLFEPQKSANRFPDLGDLSACCAKAGGAPAQIHSGVTSAHTVFSDAVADQTKRTWGAAWAKRGLERQEWKALTLFLCGGGSGITGIRKHLQNGMPNVILENVKSVPLPCPSEEECVRGPDFPEHDFHRVSVAYGLTFGSDFDAPSLPSDIKHLRLVRETRDIGDGYVPMEMV